MAIKKNWYLNLSRFRFPTFAQLSRVEVRDDDTKKQLVSQYDAQQHWYIIDDHDEHYRHDHSQRVILYFFFEIAISVLSDHGSSITRGNT